jgi:hypothetical protein
MEEIRHINETTPNDLLKEFKRSAEDQAKWRKEGVGEPCLECKFIALKLGLEV